MKNFTKIVNPCFCDISCTGNPSYKNAFCKITYQNGELSITGVVGPTSNGNCYGSAGQCVKEIRRGTPSHDWSKKSLQKFCDVWEKFHLNHLRPYCEHQEKLGWPELAKCEVNIWHYTTNRNIEKQQQNIKQKAIEDLQNGKTVRLTKDEREILSLKSYIDLPYRLRDGDRLCKFYEFCKKYDWNDGPVSVKMLGWLRPDEHPDGILTKPCPVCGYKYGTDWIKETVPEGVLQWLYNLPETKIRPAWV